ncbi:hypothetical protein JTB14_021794 [Gonioctena quinquepunctata]|nr:hypothetical protein JTB14_021794 [Gonioctena quinquepunctata]
MLPAVVDCDQFTCNIDQLMVMKSFVTNNRLATETYTKPVAGGLMTVSHRFGEGFDSYSTSPNRCDMLFVGIWEVNSPGNVLRRTESSVGNVRLLSLWKSIAIERINPKLA